MQLDTKAPDAQPAPELTHREILEVLFGLMAALFTAIISSTIVANALPTIIADLNGSQTQYTWVVTASLLAMTVTTPIWGKLSDLFSKKLLVQLSIIIFVIGSILAGISQNVPELIAMRAIQGIGMGGLTANVQAILGSIISPRERGRYSGYMGATMAVATVSGPLLGGVIVDTPGLGWRWTFFVCVPLAVLSLVILQKYLRLVTIRREAHIDYLGALFISIAASLPLIWVSFAGNSFDWVSVPSALFVGASLLATAIAIFIEARHPEPMVSLSVLRDRTTALAIIGSISVGIAMFGGSVFLGQYFQIAGGHSPTEAGLLGIPLMLGSFVGTVGSGRLITRTGKLKRYLVIGSSLLFVGLGLLGTVDHSTPEWHTMIFMALMGLGMGMLLQNYVLAVQNTVDVTDVGSASAAVAFFRSLGGTVGVSVLGAILASQVKTDVTGKLAAIGVPADGGGGGSLFNLKEMPAPVVHIIESAYGDATGFIFMIAAGVSAVSLVTALLMKDVPLRTTVHKAASAPVDTDEESFVGIER